MRKILGLFIFASILCFADGEISMQAIKKQQDEKTKQKVEEKAKHSIDKKCDYNVGLFFTCQFLYWKAHMNAVPYGFHIQDNTNQYGQAGYHEIQTNHYLNFGSKWDPGVRAGMGYNLPYDQWDLYSTYTYYRNEIKKENIVDDNTLYGINYYPNANLNLTGLNELKASWKLDYQMFDLELGKSYYIKQYLAMRPHVGLQGGWINQDRKTTYNDSTQFEEYYIEGPVNVDVDNDYWGVGPRAGFNLNFHIVDSLVFFGDIDFALLFGEAKFKTVAKWYRQPPTTTGHYVTRTNVNKYFEMKPALQMLLGFAWGTCFNDGKMFISLDAAAEYNYYWDQSLEKVYYHYYQMLNANPGSLDLIGLTTGIRFEF